MSSECVKLSPAELDKLQLETLHWNRTRLIRAVGHRLGGAVDRTIATLRVITEIGDMLEFADVESNNDDPQFGLSDHHKGALQRCIGLLAEGAWHELAAAAEREMERSEGAKK